MQFLLDDELLSGVHDVATSLRPQRAVRRVDEGAPADVIAMMGYLCQVWGGHAHPIVPTTEMTVPEPYRRCLYVDQYDIVDRRDPGDPLLDLPERINQEPAWDHPAILVAAHLRREMLRQVEVAELESDDPWAPIYAACVGVLPRAFDAGLREFAGLPEGFRFDEIVPIEYVKVAGSLEDLVGRLAKTDVLSPRQLANASLASGLEPDTSFLGNPPLLPSPHHERRAAGPNIVVVVSKGNVADLALLWNLRGAHGDRRAMPIGLPADQLTREALSFLQRPGVATMFGLGGGGCRLTSVSVPVAELAGLAASTPSVVAVPYEQLLTFGPAPGRPHSQVATFTAGAAFLEAMTESDREVLTVSRAMFRKPQLVLDVRVTDAPLPTDLTMRGARYGLSYQSGAAQVSVNANSLSSVQVRWPSSWTSLSAVARTRGLHISQSEPGRAAATLIGALGSIDSIRWLAHRSLIALLYRLAERSGMSWQKRQLNHLRARLTAQGRATDIVDDAEAELTLPEHIVTPAGEGRTVGFEDFRKALSNERAAARWVTWAERHHLLVRGVSIDCPHCRAASWLPMASMPPPVGCPGCGRSISEPYEPRHIPFAYRIGEPLRRVLETDSLGHVLALHWLTKLLDQPRGLIGAHPGVEFCTGGDKNRTTIGEADVLLLFADGSLVPVEVKRTAAGVDSKTLELMDRLANAVEAPYDVVAVSQPARDCPFLPGAVTTTARPRLVITDDQVFDRRPFWSVSTNPFAWNPTDEADEARRDSSFVAELNALDPNQPQDPVYDSLLDEHK